MTIGTRHPLYPPDPDGTQPGDYYAAINGEIQAYRVGPVVPHNAAITLAEHDTAWPEMFAREADRIRAALGRSAVLIEHAGARA